MVVIGGTAAWYGAPIGAIVLVWLPELLRFSGEARSIVQGLIVLIIIVYAPNGAVGLIRRIRALLASGLRRVRGSGGGSGTLPGRLAEESGPRGEELR
jgi:branched-chain amino acid transport system permease protein